MATFRKVYVKPLPVGAVLFVRDGVEFARWRNGRGRMVTARTSVNRKGEAIVLMESQVYTAKYRDGDGRVVSRTTGCRDRGNALAFTKGRELLVEKVRAGLIAPAEAHAMSFQNVGLGKHLEDYLEHLRARGLSGVVVRRREVDLGLLFEVCGFRRLSDLAPEPVERWLNGVAVPDPDTGKSMGAARRNAFRGALLNFVKWAIGARRLNVNPFVHLPRANEGVDRRRHRRALSVGEMERLLVAALHRPLHDRLNRNRGIGQAVLAPGTVRKLGLLGYERAMIYKTLLLTGLRKGELASITLGQVDLVEGLIHLEARYAKNRRGADIVIPGGLVEDLRVFIGRVHGEDAGPGVRLFRVPAGLDKIFQRDRAHGGIAEVDSRGRRVDVHALRHTYATQLARTGASPQTAQLAMRHADPKLTVNVYTDPAHLAVVEAVNRLPVLELPRADLAAGTRGHGEEEGEGEGEKISRKGAKGAKGAKGKGEE